jgi:hypothetical protein
MVGGGADLDLRTSTPRMDSTLQSMEQALETTRHASGTPRRDMRTAVVRGRRVSARC